MRIFKLIISLLIIFAIYCYFIFPSFAKASVPVWASGQEPLEEVDSDIGSITNDNNSLNLESASAILIEQSTGQVLYAHNIHEQLRPASVTKVMSILLIM